jgi:hypothetical protein
MTQAILTLLVTLSGQPAAADDLFFARGVGNETFARVFEHNLLGPAVQIGVLGHSVRGRAFGARADLTWDGERVTGQVAGGRVDLKYRDDEGRLALDGVFAGSAIHLELSPTDIAGHIVGRQLALKGADGIFASEDLEIGIPEALSARDAGERAAVLPLLIAGVTGVKRAEAPLFRVAPPVGWPNHDSFVTPGIFAHSSGAGGPYIQTMEGGRRHQ